MAADPRTTHRELRGTESHGSLSTMNAAYAWPRCRVGPLTTTALVAAVPAENSLSTKIGPGAKAKSEPAVMDRRAPQVYQKRLSPDPDKEPRRHQYEDSQTVRYRPPHHQWQVVVDAVTPRGAGSDGANHRLGG